MYLLILNLFLLFDYHNIIAFEANNKIESQISLIHNNIYKTIPRNIVIIITKLKQKQLKHCYNLQVF